MKRSDMLKFIVDKLFYGSLASRVDNESGFITELCEKDAERILEEMENLGIRAPSRKLDYGEYQAIRMLCSEPFDIYHQWDREDENS